MSKIRCGNFEHYEEFYQYCKDFFTLSSDGYLKNYNGKENFMIWRKLNEILSNDADDVLNSLLPDREERYEKVLKPLMRKVNGGKFIMGTDASSRVKYCGETPAHEVEISPFYVSSIPVTNRIIFSI
jgi:formylglycine-generating enzyme required for sulfatase activity